MNRPLFPIGLAYLERPEECQNTCCYASKAKRQPDDPEEGGGGGAGGGGDEGLQLNQVLLLVAAPMALIMLKVQR